MFNLNALRNLVFPLYLIIYLIFPNSAITQLTKVDLRRNLENALNSRDLKFIKKTFREKESLEISKKFSNIINEFPNAKWNIKRLKSTKPEEYVFQIKIVGEKVIDKEIYKLESNFDYLISISDDEIKSTAIENLFTIIRNDKNKIDISFNIPDKVLTGTKYDIDIVLNQPLEGVIIAGGIKPHQSGSFLQQEIDIIPLVAGGIFKVTRAPSKPGTQIWSGIIAHPKGFITFTKNVLVVEKI